MAERRHLLARGAGDDAHGYVAEPEKAMRAGGDPDPPTLVVFRPTDSPPEPEAVPPGEIASYTGSALARARFEHELSERRLLHEAQPIEARLGALRELAAERRVDISSETRVIERRVKALERKLLDRAA